ncbi:hypothetical protein C1H46_044923 [Malus baccata]|uniref:Major facilitator superfamily (MFS) profile domain-containing protein n=1 Tax=Malus baccata TaxID=106549 RepID=A0A540K5N3_MALBA|nr:hypothetical protein C1H46_044923 [Malus baccata]
MREFCKQPIRRVQFSVLKSLAEFNPHVACNMSRWLPTQERASAIGISMAGFHLGNVTGLLLTLVMLSTMGISGPFILLSSIEPLWLTVWAYTVTNDPRESRYISKSEVRVIQAGKSDSPKNERKASIYTAPVFKITNTGHYFYKRECFTLRI